MKFLFYLGHPAHFHNLKVVTQMLEEEGHQVLLVAREKDVLFQLLERSNFHWKSMPARKNRGKIGLVASVAGREWAMWKIARSFKPDLMAGTDLVITHVGKALGISAVVINEDDAAAIPLMARWAFPCATAIIAPNCCDQSPANAKKIGYNGYQELAYLHPNHFTPNREKVTQLFGHGDPYFILRFASLHAHHDKDRSGIDDQLALQIIEFLNPHGRVYITSERTFSKELEPYRIAIHPTDMHDVLAFAELFIGDSQTMTAESAVLGVPAIRFNDFVGELNYLEELEHKFHLCTGIRTSDPQRLTNTISAHLELPNRRADFKEKRIKMLNETIDVAVFLKNSLLEIARR